MEAGVGGMVSVGGRAGKSKSEFEDGVNVKPVM